MPDFLLIALVFLLVIGLGFGLNRANPNPPNPLRSGDGFFARNFWANTWWSGAGLVLLSPVLGYFEGIWVGAMMLLVGGIFVLVEGAVLRG